jgi:uncharacterized protein
MYIKRKLEDTILKNLNSREYLAIVGPRQAGKTTLIRKIQSKFDNSIYLSFEDRELLALFDRNIKQFARDYARYKYIFIDEFQYSRAGGKNLKYLFDLHPNFKFIITGSSAIDLTVKAIKHLVGRIFVFNLYQLDFSEFLAFKSAELSALYEENLKEFSIIKNRLAVPHVSVLTGNELYRLIEEFIAWGGYPRVVLAESPEEKSNVLKNIYNTYFLRDIKDIAGLIDDYKLVKLVKALAVQTGQIVEYNELCKLSEYDYITLKKYLNILDKTFICQPVRPYFTNKTKELVKNPKIYFFDSGLRNLILNNFNFPADRTDKGALFENFIFTELLKKEIPVNYWRTKQKAEVDFVVQAEALRILPIEAKNKINDSEISRSFHSFLSRYSPQTAIIYNQNYFGEKKIGDTNVFFLPYWLI